MYHSFEIHVDFPISSYLPFSLTISFDHINSQSLIDHFFVRATPFIGPIPWFNLAIVSHRQPNRFLNKSFYYIWQVDRDKLLISRFTGLDVEYYQKHFFWRPWFYIAKISQIFTIIII